MLLLKDRDPLCGGVQFQTTPARDLAVPASIAARPGAAWSARLLRNEIGRMAADGSLASLHAKWFLVTSVETGAFDQLHSAQRDLRGVQWLAFGVAVLLALTLLQTYRLKKFRVNAERANGLKTRFVANVSHELRTPLSGIVGLVDMLSDTRMTAHQTELLRVVRSTALSLVQVINDLLDVAKVEAGQLEIRKTSFELRSAVEEVCAMMAGRAAGKGIRLESALDPGLPRRVNGDATRLRELLMNLVGNAMQYTDHGEVRLTVALEQATPFQWMIAFTVTDTGVGIPREDLARLFQDIDLQSEPGAKPVRRGGGLGLAIGKRLVDLLGGTIAAESPGGVGARFRCVLPFEMASADGEPAPSRDQPKSRPLRVLVCEDDPGGRSHVEEAGTRSRVGRHRNRGRHRRRQTAVRPRPHGLPTARYRWLCGGPLDPRGGSVGWRTGAGALGDYTRRRPPPMRGSGDGGIPFQAPQFGRIVGGIGEAESLAPGDAILSG